MCNKQMRRDKVEAREAFTYEYKLKIAKKTDGVCSHCGKKIEVGGQFTVDHVIPISQGGTNDYDNLTPLCRDCNQEKGDKMVSMYWYPYLRLKYADGIAEYMKRYHDAHAHIGINYLDKYDVIPFEYAYPIGNNGFAGKGVAECYKACYSDLDDIYRFYINYFRDMMVKISKDEIKSFLSKCFSYGAIYFMREKYGNVACVLPLVPMSYGVHRGYYSSLSALFPATRYKKLKYYCMLLGMLSSVENNVCELLNTELFQIRVSFAYRDSLLLNLFKTVTMGDGIYKNYRSPEIIKYWFSRHLTELQRKGVESSVIEDMSDSSDKKFSKLFTKGVHEDYINIEDLEVGVGVDFLDAVKIHIVYCKESEMLTIYFQSNKPTASVGISKDKLDEILKYNTITDLAMSILSMEEVDTNKIINASISNKLDKNGFVGFITNK